MVIACILGGLILTAALLYAWVFLIGQKTESPFVYCDVQVEGQHITAKGWAADSISVVRKIRFKEEDGVVTMTPVIVWASVFHPGEFWQEYDAKGEIREVRMNGRVLWRKTDVSDVSARLSEDVLENYREWDQKSEAAQMLSSTRPGLITKYFESWEEAEEYLGYQFDNPFEGAKGYGIMNTAGADIIMPQSNVLEHVSVSFAGNRNGEILWLCVTSGYQTKGVRVVYNIEPFGRREEMSLSYDENGLVYDGVVPIGVQVSEDPATSSDAEVVGCKTIRSSTERYTAEDILYRRSGISYSVRLVSFDGEEALDEAEASVLERIDN